jgi:hypothetical protein
MGRPIVTYVPPKPKRTRRATKDVEPWALTKRMYINWQKYYLRRAIFYDTRMHFRLAKRLRKKKQKMVHQDIFRSTRNLEYKPVLPFNDSRISFKYDLIKKNQIILLKQSKPYAALMRVIFKQFKRYKQTDYIIRKKYPLPQDLKLHKVLIRNMKWLEYEIFMRAEARRIKREEKARIAAEKAEREAKVRTAEYKLRMKAEEEKLGNSYLAAYYRNAAIIVDMKF